MFENDYRPASGRMPTRNGGQPQFPKDPFGTIRQDPDSDRYAVRIRRDGRPRWFILVLNMPGPGEQIPFDDLRADNLDEWPVIYRPTEVHR